MKKYLQVFKVSWENGFVYRLNFVMWRVRAVMVLLTIYFFWYAIYQFRGEISGYDKQMMLTYILGTSVLRSFVFGSRSAAVSGEISTGDLSNFLLKPMSYFKYWITRDFADKLLNLIFVVFELTLILIILRPPVFFPNNPFILLGFLVSCVVAVMLFFYLSLIISLSAFWFAEHNGWPQRFLFEVIIFFLCGGLLPLDVFPNFVFNALRFLPTSYLLFFPLEVYLGRVSFLAYLQGVVLSIFWFFVLYRTVKFVWQQGLKNYAAEGR